MPGGLVLGLFMPFSGFLADRIPTRGLIISGLLCFAVSSYWLATVDVNSPFWTIAGCVVLSRIGLGLIKPSLNVTALRSLRPELLGQGAGMINFARQLGGAFGVNLLSVMLDRRTFFHSDTITAMQSAGNSGTAELLRQMQALLAQSGLSPDVQASAALNFLGRVVYAQAYTMGFRDSFLITAVVFTIGLIPRGSWDGVRRRARPPHERGSHRSPWAGPGLTNRGKLPRFPSVTSLPPGRTARLRLGARCSRTEGNLLRSLRNLPSQGSRSPRLGSVLTNRGKLSTVSP